MATLLVYCIYGSGCFLTPQLKQLGCWGVGVRRPVRSRESAATEQSVEDQEDRRRPSVCLSVVQ